YGEQDNFAESYEIESSFDVGIRRRSNTAVRLEKLKQQRKAQPKTKHVQWKERPVPFTGKLKWLKTSSQKDVDRYSLHIAEDDGEVDSDFPALDNREVISKFGFHTLAFVEAPTPPEPDKKAILVQIKYFFLRGNVPQSGFSLIEVDSLQTPMKDILHKTLKRRKGNVRVGGTYKRCLSYWII
ncbi:target of rapamycin complex 2 subunit MAPKAP1-like, partial [Saccoglossus kowalevskii]